MNFKPIQLVFDFERLFRAARDLRQCGLRDGDLPREQLRLRTFVGRCELLHLLAHAINDGAELQRLQSLLRLRDRGAEQLHLLARGIGRRPCLQRIEGPLELSERNPCVLHLLDDWVFSFGDLSTGANRFVSGRRLACFLRSFLPRQFKISLKRSILTLKNNGVCVIGTAHVFNRGGVLSPITPTGCNRGFLLGQLGLALLERADPKHSLFRRLLFGGARTLQAGNQFLLSL